tara:strand:- start:815 stop:925 length:111 start_codon:yes stop_codon:yes gene_type:complete
MPDGYTDEDYWEMHGHTEDEINEPPDETPEEELFVD